MRVNPVAQTLKVRRSSAGPLATNVVMTNKRTRPVVVPHTEYLDSLPSPCAMYSFQLNPGLPETFTWLSMQARLWEEYRIISMMFEWEPAVAATAAGTVHMAVDYDSRDADPSSIAVMSNFSTYANWPTRMPHKLVVDPALANRAMPYHYVRNGVVADSDVKTYDIGKLVIEVEGDTITHAGRLYVHYVIQFCSPTLEENDSPTVNFSGKHTSHDPYAQHVPWEVSSVVEALKPWLAGASNGLSGGFKKGDETVLAADGTTNYWEVTKDMDGLMSMALPYQYGVRSDTAPSTMAPFLGLKRKDGPTSGWYETNFQDTAILNPGYSIIQHLFDFGPRYMQFDTADTTGMVNHLYRVIAKAGDKIGIGSVHGGGAGAWTQLVEATASLFPQLVYWAKGSHFMVDLLVKRHDDEMLRRKKTSARTTTTTTTTLEEPSKKTETSGDDVPVAAPMSVEAWNALYENAKIKMPDLVRQVAKTVTSTSSSSSSTH